MGLTVKVNGKAVKNFDGEEIGRRVKIRLDQEGERAIKGLSEIMKAGGEGIMQTARDMAPFRNPGDHGGSTDMDRHLDRAIDMKVDRSGVNRRLAVTIFINGRKIGNGGKRIAEYAYLIHEGLAPYGSGIWNASEGTLGKGPQAGGKFMTRAYKAYKKKILEDSKDYCRKLFR